MGARNNHPWCCAHRKCLFGHVILSFLHHVFEGTDTHYSSCPIYCGSAEALYINLHSTYSTKISTRSPASRSCISRRRPVAPSSMLCSRPAIALPLSCGIRSVPRRKL